MVVCVSSVSICCLSNQPAQKLEVLGGLGPTLQVTVHIISGNLMQIMTVLSLAYYTTGRLISRTWCGAGTELLSVCVYGQGDKRTQIHKIRAKAEIVVATPGRLNDFTSTGKFEL
ncbi:putative ATP-dependent RNA helicase ddx17 [Portunus trituberculatus]|uniref:Putative ATP-dependent RNA helicase ddx17 n=1 Tax=Portunus trituberculatus TaxID=210409 RepID=A0A5B7FUK2_PORTR|nr:putative ATP-dependent RNA helicase ddx17 [Portunus trituberculatus]